MPRVVRSPMKNRTVYPTKRFIVVFGNQYIAREGLVSYACDTSDLTFFWLFHNTYMEHFGVIDFCHHTHDHEVR